MKKLELISDTKARIDFVYDQNIASIFEDILAEYSHIIEQDLMIKKDFFDVETQRHFWEIEGFLRCRVVVRMSDQRLKLDLLL